jgi:hypothetical protein
MKFRLPNLQWLRLVLLGGILLVPLAVLAQDDASPSLGDVARTLREEKLQQSQHSNSDPPVIDNDNLDQAMQDAERARSLNEVKTVFSIDPRSETVKVSSPDVTCSLSFNARATSLLIKPVLIEDLPLTELLKLDGPGFIQDENLELQVFNGTDWDLREITIGLTLERKPGENAEIAARARVIPAAENSAPTAVERHSDVTLLYHLKAEAKPFSTTAFRENIGITPGPDEDWRWSIVEAKGIRPSEPPSPPESLTEPLFPAPSFSDPQFAAPSQSAPTTAEPTPSQGSIATTPQPAPAAPAVQGATKDRPGPAESSTTAPTQPH